MRAATWSRIAGSPADCAHLFVEPSRTLCDRAVPEGAPIGVRDIGDVALCAACVATLRDEAERAPKPPAPPVERCGCACCAKSSVAIAYRREIAIAAAEWLADEPHAGALVQGHDEEGAT